MIFRCRLYTVVPSKMEAFTEFFTNYLFPVQERHGARLVARLQSEDGNRVLAPWIYDSREAYHAIQEKVRSDPDSEKARKYSDQHIGAVYLTCDEFFLTSTVPLETTQLAHLLTPPRLQGE